MARIDEFFLFQNATTTGQGNILSVRNRTSLMVDIFGTNVTTRTISFYKLNTNSPADLIPINGSEGSDHDVAGASDEKATFTPASNADFTG